MTDFPTGLLFDEAVAVLRDIAARHRLETESLALARCHGCVLAQDLVAPMALPPFDNSAMDGFAFRHGDLDGEETALRLVGEQFAGIANNLPLQAGECIRITTGAPMPEGADTVVIREVVRVEGDRIVVPANVARGLRRDVPARPWREW